MAIKDYSDNPSSNTTINGINIAEGCPPSGINDAIRQVMSDLKTGDFGANGLVLDAISESTVDAGVTIDGVKLKDGYVTGNFYATTIGERVTGSGVDVDGVVLKDAGVTATGKSDLDGVVLENGNITGDQIKSSGTNPSLTLYDTDSTAGFRTTALRHNADAFSVQTRNDSDVFVSYDYYIAKGATGATRHSWMTNNTEQMRLDSTGNVGVGTASPNKFGSGTKGITVNGGVGSHLEFLDNEAALGYVMANQNGLQIANNSGGSVKIGNGSQWGITVDANARPRLLENPWLRAYNATSAAVVVSNTTVDHPITGYSGNAGISANTSTNQITIQDSGIYVIYVGSIMTNSGTSSIGMAFDSGGISMYGTSNAYVTDTINGWAPFGITWMGAVSANTTFRIRLSNSGGTFNVYGAGHNNIHIHRIG